jgi:hypothetical protein
MRVPAVFVVGLTGRSEDRRYEGVRALLAER